MIKILQITNGLHRTGVQAFIMNVLKNIDRKEVMFDFLLFEKATDGFEEEALELGSKIYFYEPRKKGIMNNIRSLDRFFETHANEYHAVHYHGNSFTDLAPLIIARKHGIQVRVAHSHNSTTTGLHNILLHYLHKRFIHKIATHYLACSEDAKVWGFKGTKVENSAVVIPNGINLRHYEYDPSSREAVRKELGIDMKAFVICNTGGFRPVKNHAFMLEIFAEIKKRRADSVLILCGAGGNENDIKTSISQKGLEEAVRMVGLRKDIEKILSASDVEIFPSLYEGLPFALIEAQASGIWVFASDRITPEIKLTDRTLMLPLDKSPKEWAELILNTDNSLRESVDKTRLEKFDIRSSSRQLMDIYARSDEMNGHT